MVAGPATASHQGGEAVAEAALAGLGLESVRLSVRPSILPPALSQPLKGSGQIVDGWTDGRTDSPCILQDIALLTSKLPLQ